jgi:hypothetical protein
MKTTEKQRDYALIETMLISRREQALDNLYECDEKYQNLSKKRDELRTELSEAAATHGFGELFEKFEDIITTIEILELDSVYKAAFDDALKLTSK